VKAQEPERTAAPVVVAPVARASAEQIVVHVVDAASGAPIEAFGLREHISTLEALAGTDRPLHHAGVHTNGRLVVPAALFERRGFVIECDDARYLPSMWITAAYALQRDGERTIEVRIPAAVPVTVHVVHGRAGEPVEGARVELLRPFDKSLAITLATRAQPTAQFTAHPDASSLMERIKGGRALLLGAAVTSAEGRVHLRVPPREACTLRLPGPGHRAVLQADWTVADHEANGERVVVVPTGASVRGRVLPQTVLQQLRSLAAASNGAAPLSVQFRDRAGASPQAPIDADGRFQCDGLEPSDCQVWFHYSLRVRTDGPEPAAGKPIAIELPKLVGLTEGETRELAIGLTGWLPGTLVFTVPNDARLLPGHLSLDPLQSLGPPMPREAMGAMQVAKGERVVMTLPPGRYAAEWWNQGAKESLWLGVVDVRSGETATAAPVFAARGVQIRVVAGEGQDVAGGMLMLHGSRWSVTRTLDVSGLATCDALPIGLPLRAMFLGEARQQPDGKVVVPPQLDLGPLQVEAGTPELITLRLPAR
jgi:5-hydroxyisourate hydrolase-like protein (transthyretin family)